MTRGRTENDWKPLLILDAIIKTGALRYTFLGPSQF